MGQKRFDDVTDIKGKVQTTPAEFHMSFQQWQKSYITVSGHERTALKETDWNGN